MRSRKAQVAISTVIVLGLILGMVVYSQSHPYEVITKMGDKHNFMLSSYTEVEAAREYIISSAEYSAYQAMYDVGRFGGFDPEEFVDIKYHACSLTLPELEQPITAFDCYDEEGKSDEFCSLYEIDDCLDSSCSKPHEILCSKYDVDEESCTLSEDKGSLTCMLASNNAICNILYAGEEVGTINTTPAVKTNP